jgi:RNA polymerase sigma factor (sigma-70 family)
MSDDQLNEEALFAQYEDRIGRVALSCAAKQPGKCSTEELTHAGRLGLQRASQTYDSSKGAALWDYAEYFVRAYVLRRLAQDRSDQEKLVAKLLRSKPEGGESGAGRLYWHSFLENVLAAYASLTLEEVGAVENVSPEAALLKKEEAGTLGNAVSMLPHQERQVIEAHYTYGESFKAIASKLDVDDSVISKRHKAALAHLRVILSDPSPPVGGSAAPPPRPRKATVMTMPRKTQGPRVPPPRSSRET